MREMKLKRSTSLVTFVYINIIIFITPITSNEPTTETTKTAADSSSWPQSATPQPPVLLLPTSSPSSSSSSSSQPQQQQHYQQRTLSSNIPNHENVNILQVTEENKKLFNEQIKSQLLKVLGLREAPSNKPKTKKNKAYVPRAMLDEYEQMRESVRDFIPEDRDFYGKINIDDLHQEHEHFWNRDLNRAKRQDIEVDMEPDGEASQRLHVKRSARHLTFLTTQTEPEDVPPALEHLLPPRPRSPVSQKQFISVLLKFNLSQEYYVDPMKVDDLESAELNLFREPVHNNRTRYQRIYILEIIGFDKHNDPITRIHDSRRIDTEELSALKFDVYSIIKFWLLNPTKNYGIIVRVTNDDKENERSKSVTNASSIIDIDDDNYNNNNNNASNGATVVEHVRLKREFRSTSETDDSWLKKRPSLMIANSANQPNRNSGPSNPRSSTSGSGVGPNQKVRSKPKSARQADKCSMRTLSINFDDMGWSNWIIAPTAYFANYCAGDCSFPLLQQNATNHAIIQSIFHSVGRLTPRSCCAPTKLGKMAILYQLDGTVQMRHYEDMIVESCGCL